MLQLFYLGVAKVDLDVAYVCNGYVANVCSKCSICSRRMLKLFNLDVVKVDLNVDVEEAQG
jgi:hypothetical protein